MGWIIGPKHRYDLAFQFVSVTVLIGGVVWLWGARYLEEDTPRPDPPPAGVARGVG